MCKLSSITSHWNRQPTKVEKYEELKLLNELREKGVITQEEFDDKKGELLD